jgi:hypothetical protein
MIAAAEKFLGTSQRHILPVTVEAELELNSRISTA